MKLKDSLKAYNHLSVLDLTPLLLYAYVSNYLHEEALRTEDRILEAAYNCFSRKGYLGSTTREIAREAGISEVTLFRIFGSKKELFREVLIRYSVIPDIERIGCSASGSGRELVHTVGMRIFSSLKEKREFIKILLSETAGLTEEVREVYSQFIERLNSLLISTFSASFPKMGREELSRMAQVFRSALFGFFISEEVFRGRELSEEEVGDFIDALVGNLGREK